MDLLAESALQLCRRSSRCPRRSRADKVHHRLRLSQIELTVEEGSLCELTGPGHAGTSFKRCGQNARGDKRSSVSADLDKILAGVAARVAEDREQHLVDDLAMGINDPAEGHLPLFHRGRRLSSAEDRVGHYQCPGSAHPDDCKGPLAGRCGQRGNGLLHGYFLRTSLSSSMQRRFWSMVPTEMRIHSGRP